MSAFIVYDFQLHFNDIRAYSDIYSVESKFTKDSNFYPCFNCDHSAFGATNPDEAKTRRGVMHTFFSRRAVLDLEGLIRQKVCLPGFSDMFAEAKSRLISLSASYRRRPANPPICSLPSSAPRLTSSPNICLDNLLTL